MSVPHAKLPSSRYMTGLILLPPILVLAADSILLVVMVRDAVGGRTRQKRVALCEVAPLAVPEPIVPRVVGDDSRADASHGRVSRQEVPTVPSCCQGCGGRYQERTGHQHPQPHRDQLLSNLHFSHPCCALDTRCSALGALEFISERKRRRACATAPHVRQRADQ